MLLICCREYDGRRPANARQSITLTANGGCSVNGAGIRWSTGAETETIVVTPLTTTTYTAYCTAGQVISQSSNTVKVTVSNSVTISGQISYTAGQTILLTATASPSAGATYTWSGPQLDGAESYSSTGAVLQRIGATANYSGTYTVKATNNDGCLGQASVQVVVTPASCTGITAAISAPAAITAGQALTLTGSVTPANASATYRWSGPAGSGPAGFTSTAGAPTIPAATTANSGVYSLTVTLPGGCTATANATVTVVPAATTSCAGTSVTVIAPTSLTAGQALTLSAVSSPAAGSATYIWSGPAGFTSTASAPAIPNTTTANSGTYSLTIALAGPNGCTATASASVTVVPAGTTACTGLSASIAAPAGVTAGQPLSLTAIVSSASTSMVYAWTGPTGFTATTPVAAIPATTTAHSGTYSLTVQVAGQSSCSATAATTITVVSNTDTLTIDCDISIVSVDAAAQETVFIPRSVTGQNALTLSVENLGGTPLTGYTYRWTRTTGVQTASATSTTATSGTATAPVTVTVGTTPTISATAIGEYMVVLTDAAGNTCVAYSTISAKPCNERTAAYSSCKDVTITNPDATNAISNLAPGDQFYAGDYKVTVTSITDGGPGGWTGEGIVDVTLLKGINLPAQVTFDNAKLNDCYELAAGKLVTKYDPSWISQNNNPTQENPNIIITELKDLLSVFSGSKSDQDQITKLFNELDETIRFNFSISDELKFLCLDSLSNTKKLWLQFQESNVGEGAKKQISNGVARLAINNCPTSEVINQGLDNIASRIPTFQEWIENLAPFYQTDGHYGTVYLIGLMLGLENAEELALFAELPDNEIKGPIAGIRTTWFDPDLQKLIHSLTYGFHSKEEFETSVILLQPSINDPKLIGYLIHRYGDTFAHTRLEDSLKRTDLRRMYGKISNPYIISPRTFEHQFVDGKTIGEAPDMIKNRPEWYMKYVENLANILAIKYSKDPKKIDLNLFKELAYYARDKNVSLMGIIHYHIAEKKGLNYFTLPFPEILIKPYGYLGNLAESALETERSNYNKWVVSASEYIKNYKNKKTLKVERRTKMIYPKRYKEAEPVEMQYEATFKW